MRRAIVILILLASGAWIGGCREKGRLTILFTSDVRAWLTPAG